MELIRPNSTFLRFTWLARAGEIARRHWALALAFSFPLAMYTITLAGTVFGLDSAEFSAAAYSLGVPHATGYPLYMMLGKLFTFLPMGDVGYRLNLMSAVFAAFTVAVVYQILLLVTTRALLSLALSLFFAFSYYFWTASVIAEVYTLHALLTGLVILMWLMWNQKQDRKLLYLAAAIWGLSFGNHISTVLLGPAFGYMLLVAFQRKALPWQSLMVMAGLFILGLSTYAYLPWRYLAEATPHVGRFDNEGVFTRIDLTSIQGMWWMLSGKDYGAFLFPYDLLGALNELALRPFGSSERASTIQFVASGEFPWGRRSSGDSRHAALRPYTKTRICVPWPDFCCQRGVFCELRCAGQGHHVPAHLSGVDNLDGSWRWLFVGYD